jgi:OmpA-like transmembrane domain
MKLTTGLLAAAIALATAPAFATDTGFYVGAGMGYSKISINENKLDNNIDAALPAPWFVDKSNVDQNATPYMFTFGYRLMPYLAAEVAYIDMGSASYKANATTPKGGNGIVKGTWSADGWPVSVLGIWPINDTWEVFGRVGAMFGSVDLKARAVDGATSTQLAKLNASNNSNQFFGGVGVDANFMESWAARFEWQAMPSLGNDDTGSGNFNNLMFSILYKF